MDSKKVMVCTVYDKVAQEHGPVFYAQNEGILWRNVDGLRKTLAVPDSDFVVCVHMWIDLAVLDFQGEVVSEFFDFDRHPVVL